ncbi:MAG: hypothetical protein C5B51_28725 [Terriglobia bacterium]|nr:MAG: hypothetical protein C5B51_28725 [Terriglobia bacterium]
MPKFSCSILLGLFLAVALHASISIQGVVVDENQQPVTGVLVSAGAEAGRQPGEALAEQCGAGGAAGAGECQSGGGADLRGDRHQSVGRERSIPMAHLLFSWIVTFVLLSASGWAAPSIVSVLPVSGTGSSQTFAVTVSDPAGPTSIWGFSFLINAGINGANACWIWFDHTANTLQLAYDDQSGFSPAITVGTNFSLSNSQCTVSASGASVSTSGNNLTVNIPLTFTLAFFGNKNSYVLAYDTGDQNSGWQNPNGAYWGVTQGPPTLPAAPTKAVVPDQGSGPQQTFTVTMSDPNGYTNLDSLSFLISGGLDGRNACWVLVYRASHTMLLANDASNGWLGPIDIQTPGQSIYNGQCRLSTQGASMSGSGNNLTVNIPLTFFPTFTGHKYDYTMGTDAVMSTVWPWPQPGAWDPNPPGVSSVVPGSGSGSSQTFAVTATDVNGPAAIAYISFLVNTGLDGRNGCWVLYQKSGNTLQLANDAATGFSAPVTIGTNASLSNSQCTLSALTASTSSSGNNVTVNLPIAFLPVFAGAKSSYADATDTTGVESGWKSMGSWTVPGGSYTISGRVTLSGAGLNGVSIALSGSQTGGATTDANGNYSLPSLGAGGNYTVTASKNGYTMSAAQTFNNLAANQTANFTATLGQYTATSIADLTNNCLQSATQFPICTLAPGTYGVTQTIVVGRSNVTIQGGGTSPSQTILLRDPGFPSTGSAACVNTPSLPDCGSNAPLMQVKPTQSPTLSGVKIQNLTICGNSNIYPNPRWCPLPVPTNCSDRTSYQTSHDRPPGGYPFALCVDLSVANLDTGQNPFNPFAYTGPYSLEIANTYIEGAAGHAVSLYPTIDQVGEKVNDIYIHDSEINASGVTGILIGANVTYQGKGYHGRKCDSIANYPNQTNILPAPRNIRIEGNWFWNNNTSGIGAPGTSRWIGLRNNHFVNNYNNPQVRGNEVGGNVFLDECVDTVEISGNTMTGPTSPAYDNTSGLELWGRNITVANGNSISGYPLEGIGVNSTYNLTITGNQIANNSNVALGNGEIYAWTNGFGACQQVPRDMQIGTISGNNLTGNTFGVHLGDYPNASRDTIHNLTITADNTFPASPIREDYMVAVVDGFSYPPQDPPSPGPIPPTNQNANDTGPLRVLPVLNSLQYPLCPAQGYADSTEDTFTFSAADAYGPGNIYDIEGVFSQFGSDTDGSGGPGNGVQGGDCHFIYYPASNTVYLDSQNGDYSWTGGHSAVGQNNGGNDLTNGYCTIHAGSANSGSSPEAKILNLKLDISFHSGSSHQHLYQLAYDQINDLFSYGQSWYYWGWWLAQ